MKFNISKIVIENFRSIQEKVTLDINPGLFAIQGINLDEDGSTNGCGKSSIVSALYWCLTGNALTNEILADEVVNSKVGKNCKVVVYIDSDRGEIKITRTRKDSELGNNLILEIAGQNISCHKISDTQERLNQLLKIPFNLLHSTIIMTSDIKSAFSDLTPQQRIQTLESIRDYTVWDKVRDEANKDIKQYNKDITENNLKISNFQGSLSTYENLLSNNLKLLTENGQNLISNEFLEECNIKFKNQLFEIKEKIAQNEKEMTLFDAKIVEIDTLFGTKNVQETTKSAENIINNEIKKEDLDKIVEEANNIKLQIQKLKFEKESLNKEISVIDKWLKDDVCPTCKRPLERNQSDIELKLNEKQVLNTQLLKTQEQIDNCEKLLIDKRSEWSNKNKLFAEFEEKKKIQEQQKYLALQEEVKKKDLLKKQYSDSILELSKANKELEIERKVVENKISVLNTLETYKQEINKLNLEINSLKLVIDELSNKKQLSEYFYKLLGSKGELRPYLLNKDIQYLNSCMQRYINVFFKNTSVKLVLNGATIDILIDSKGIKKNVSSLSGGEKKRLNLAIQLALYDLLKSTSQISFNTLWLDEVESQLDSLGVQQLIEIIEDKSEEISSVFWITNNNMVKENIPSSIICTKKFGKTEVSYK